MRTSTQFVKKLADILSFSYLIPKFGRSWNALHIHVLWTSFTSYSKKIINISFSEPDLIDWWVKTASFLCHHWKWFTIPCKSVWMEINTRSWRQYFLYPKRIISPYSKSENPVFERWWNNQLQLSTVTRIFLYKNSLKYKRQKFPN